MFFNIYAFSLKKKIYVYEEASSNVEKECMKMQGEENGEAVAKKSFELHNENIKMQKKEKKYCKRVKSCWLKLGVNGMNRNGKN